MKKQHGGIRNRAGRKALPGYLKKVRAGNLRITKYKMDALRTLSVSLGQAIEQALDSMYPDLFEAHKQKQEEESNV